MNLKNYLAITAALCSLGTATSAQIGKITAMDTRTKGSGNPAQYVRGTSRSNIENGTVTSTDSSVLVYNSAKAWDPIAEVWNFSKNITLHRMGTGTYDSVARNTTTRDNAGRITSYKIEYYNETAGAFEPSMDRQYSYDVSGRLKRYDVVYPSPAGIARTDTYYDTLGAKIFEVGSFQKQSMPAFEEQTRYYWYMGMEDTMIQQNWNPMTSTWDHTSRTITNYALGKISEYLTSRYVNGSWVDNLMDSYTYAMNGNQTTLERKRWVNGVWENEVRNTFSYNTAVDMILKTTELYQNGMYQYLSQDSSIFNSNHQLTSEIVREWSDGQNSFIDVAVDRYYYGDVPVGIAGMGLESYQVQVYPVPAQNVMTLSVNWGTEIAADITVHDMSGKVVKRITQPKATQTRTVIHTDDMPAGNYIIHVKGNGQLLTRTVSVVK